MLHDVIIVGGSYSGMAAALQLARARKDVAVVDAGQRRNRFAEASHGFLGQDGQPPGAIAAQARAQLLSYPTVTWVEGKAVAATAEEGQFRVTLETGEERTARRLLLATGVVDNLPDVPGLQERWGRGVYQCPYCDGYELNQGHLGVLATSGFWFHQAMLIPEWGRTTLFTNGIARPDAEQRAALARRGVTIEEAAVTGIAGERVTVQLEDGRSIALAGLFLVPRTSFASPLASQLGCTLEEGPMGPFIWTDIRKETSVPGVFACGDAARAAGSVSLAVGDGAIAGTGIHQSLIFR
ncbi:NAD(P)/FAD-dependent oxidoreductase [Roseomonas sp. KE2513]|uniref:NAD(P)/FAD-dependent oxidoreductase n=1 Tax=Roseomonas sp. KE2513 TaxID=2479202 RepID=UPI0018DEF658|nr:NAD(P)/FAD-dependent oxidoreductase [Roseomonas sp. KE2513]MBI0537105.1 NAD(P)/FAD-dependent oxidoreductase [Roseomonas sp. KE2513]